MKDFCRLVRLPNLLVIILFECLLRYAYILPALADVGISASLSHARFVILVISVVCIAAGGNVINDYFDLPTDRINRPDTVVVGSRIDRRVTLLLHVLLTLVGLLGGLYLSFVLRKASLLLLFVGVPMVLWFYSTHFKRQMLVGNIVVALLVALSGYVVICVEYAAIDRYAGHTLTNTEPYSEIWFVVCAYCCFAFVSNIAREIIKDMEDANGDEQTGCRTMAVMMGAKYSKAVVVGLELILLVALVFALVQKDVGMPMWAYTVCLVLVPTLGLIWQTMRATDPSGFHRVATLSKLIMLFGVLSVWLVG